MDVFSVSDIINFYFNNNICLKKKNKTWNYHMYIGIWYHKIIEMYLLLKNHFDIYYFFNCNNIDYNLRNILYNLYNITINFLNKNQNWKYILYEKNINYYNIYGKPDIIFEYKNNNQLCNNQLLFLKYYSNIYSGILNSNIIDLCVNMSSYKQIILVDWKCYKKNNIFVIYDDLPYFLQHIIKNNKYNKSMIQMNIYKYILEQKYNCIVSEMYIHVINAYTYTCQLIPIINLKKEFIVYIIDFFLKQNNKKHLVCTNH